MSPAPHRSVLACVALRTVDPYFMKNHLGTYECKLCLTLHTNEGSYLAHTQGKKHQQNLARRAAKLERDRAAAPLELKRPAIKKTVKIGRPGYKVCSATLCPASVLRVVSRLSARSARDSTQ